MHQASTYGYVTPRIQDIYAYCRGSVPLRCLLAFAFASRNFTLLIFRHSLIKFEIIQFHLAFLLSLCAWNVIARFSSFILEFSLTIYDLSST